jgi:hypothetical protein
MTLIEWRGSAPLTNMLTAMGGWPVIMKNWRAENWNLIESIKTSQNFGFSSDFIISIDITVDLKNSTKRVVEVSY